MLGGNSFDEQLKRKQKNRIYLPHINARSLAQKKQNYSYLDYSKVKKSMVPNILVNPPYKQYK